MAHTLGLTVYHPDKADHGYTLFAPITGTSAYLLDMQGCVVHHWSLPYRPGLYGYLLDNGHLLVAGRTGKSPVPFGGAGGTLMELDWDGTVRWEYIEDTMHHDFCRLPNGNTMILGWEPVPADMVPCLSLRSGLPRAAGENLSSRGVCLDESSLCGTMRGKGAARCDSPQDRIKLGPLWMMDTRVTQLV